MKQSHINPLPVGDPWLLHAIQTIEATYGDEVSVRAKNQDLHKFGHRTDIGTSLATIQHLPTGILHETYLTTNDITTIVSVNDTDDQEVVLETHTIDGDGNFTFVHQTATLNGQTPVALDTPCARVSRIFNIGATDFIGPIYVCEDDTFSSGVPNTASGVHLLTHAGDNISDKAAIVTASNEYLILTSYSADLLKKTAGYAEVIFQVRYDIVFISFWRIAAGSNSGRGTQLAKPYFIIPPNSDIRLAAIADSSNTAVSGGIQGVSATIRGTE